MNTELDTITRAGDRLHLPVAPGAFGRAGGVVCLNAEGLAAPPGEAGADFALGWAEHTADNRKGKAGTVTVRLGLCHLDNSPVDPVTVAHIGTTACFADDHTVAASGAASGGLIFAVDEAGVWVDFRLIRRAGAEGGTGTIGPQGPPGPQGEKGDKGDKGDSAAAYDDTALTNRVAAVESTLEGLAGAAPQWQTSGAWTYRITGNWLEAVYTALNQTIAVTNGSGVFYRSDSRTLTVPDAVRGGKTLTVKNCNINCGHSGYPVATTLESIVENGFTWYAISGSSRNSTGGYAITAKIEGFVA